MSYKKGDICTAKVTAIVDYGAFVIVSGGYVGLIHISEITPRYVKDINDFLKIGDVLKTKIIDVDEEKKHLNLSVKNASLISETSHGFSTLEEKLPGWIEKKIKKIEKEKNSLDNH